MKEREIKEKITFAKQQQMDSVKLLKEEQWPLCPVSVMKMIRWKDKKTPKMKTRVCTETGHEVLINTGADKFLKLTGIPAMDIKRKKELLLWTWFL